MGRFYWTNIPFCSGTFIAYNFFGSVILTRCLMKQSTGCNMALRAILSGIATWAMACSGQISGTDFQKSDAALTDVENVDQAVDQAPKSLIPCEWIKVTGVGSDTLSMRDSPSKSGTVLTQLYEGTVAQVLDAQKAELIEDSQLGLTSDLWVNIKRGSFQGWVSSVYTSCTTAPPGGSVWTWPVPTHDALSQGFKNPSSAYTCGWHPGIDIPAPIGTPIVAASDGVVVHVGYIGYSGEKQGVGPYAIIIEHIVGTLYSKYGHNNAAHVTIGQAVKAGDRIADVGTLGFSTGPHLHFEIVEGVPFTGDWAAPFADACSHYQQPLLYVGP